MSTYAATSDQVTQAASALGTALLATGGVAALKSNPTGFVTTAVSGVLTGFSADQLQQLGTELVNLTALGKPSDAAGSARSRMTPSVSAASDSSDLPYFLQCPQDCMLTIVALVCACIAVGLLLAGASLTQDIVNSVLLEKPNMSHEHAAAAAVSIGLAFASMAALALVLAFDIEPQCLSI